MEQTIYRSLPESHRAIVDEIESASGLQISVISEIATNSLFSSIADSGDEGASAIATYETATIIYTGRDNMLTHDDYLHELLHLHRYYVEGIPQLFSHSTTASNFSALIENIFEHQYIYEGQFTISSASHRKFSDEIQSAWKRYPWSLKPETLRLYRGLRYWATLSYADSAIGILANDYMRKTHDFTGTKRIVSKLDKLKSSNAPKATLVRVLLDYVGVPATAFFLRRLEPRSLRFVDTPL